MQDDVQNVFEDSIFEHPSGFTEKPERYTLFVISQLHLMGTNELEATARQAYRFEGCAFLIRAACLFETLRRVTKSGCGRGNKAAPGEGITEVINTLAREWNLAPRTLQDDRLIYKTFFLNGKTSDVDIACLVGIGREYFRWALKTIDPWAAILIAACKIREGGYSVRQFHSETEHMLKRSAGKPKSDTPADEQPTEDGCYPLFLDDKTWATLRFAIKKMRDAFPEQCASPERFIAHLINTIADRYNMEAKK